MQALFSYLKWLDAMSECLVFSLRKKTLRENTRPYRYHGLKIFTSLRLRFQDFQRWIHKSSPAEGVAIPHAIYDIARNEGYVNIGTSRDTSEFACDSIRRWWNDYGKVYYPDARSILMLMDGGGSNSSRHYIFNISVSIESKHS